MSKKDSRASADLTFTFTLKGGWQWRARVYQDGNELTVRSDMLRDDRPLTKRQNEIWQEWQPWFTALLIKQFSDAFGAEEKAAADLAKWIDGYESFNFGKLYSPEKREAFLFLKHWRRERLLAQASGETISDSDQIKLLAPLLDALDGLKAEFLEYLTQSARTLRRRYKPGSVECLDRWLLEYKLRVPPSKARTRTPEQIQKFISKFDPQRSVKKIHEKLEELHVPHKHKPRGRASPNYGFGKKWGELKAGLSQE
jgi:hypothetical protein